MGSNINDNFKNSNSDLKELIKKSQEGSQFKIYETQVNEFLNEVLFTSNKRDDELINFRLKWIIEALNEDLERAINLEFGGSHNKGTFVSGLSDIDALLLLNNTNLKNKSPRIIQEFIKNKLLNSKKIIPIEIKIGYL